MAKTTRAPRRSTEEVRALILEAAGDLFGERGYAQTTMRAVAESAGISLSVLHRQFPSKERLFSETFVAPFAESFEEFTASWSARADGAEGDEAAVGAFIKEFHRSLLPHRHTIVTLLAAGEDPDTKLVDEARAALGGAWGELLNRAPSTSGGSDSPELVRDTTMLSVALVTGLVLFHPWVRVARGDDDEQALVDLAATLLSP